MLFVSCNISSTFCSDITIYQAVCIIKYPHLEWWTTLLDQSFYSWMLLLNFVCKLLREIRAFWDFGFDESVWSIPELSLSTTPLLNFSILLQGSQLLFGTCWEIYSIIIAAFLGERVLDNGWWHNIKRVVKSSSCFSKFVRFCHLVFLMLGQLSLNSLAALWFSNCVVFVKILGWTILQLCGGRVLVLESLELVSNCGRRISNQKNSGDIYQE